MARQVGTKITGTFGNQIYYKFRGGYYIRQKPSVVRQTKRTKEAAGQYGKASALAKQLRIYLEPLIPDPKSKALRDRLTSAVYPFLTEADLDHLNGFELHDLKGIGRRLTIQPVITREHDGTLSLKLPAFNPKTRLPGTSATSQVRLSVMAAFLCPDPNDNMATEVHDLLIPYDDTLIGERTFILANDVPQSCLITVALGMQFLKKTGSTHDRKADLAWIAGCLN